MLFSTPTQYAVLALLLVAGWLFGLASHPGGRRWKQRYADERDAHALTRKDQDGRLTTANARIAELERDNARLAKAAPVTAATIAPTTAATPVERPVVATRAVAASEARPAYVRPAGERRGWFDWGNRPAI